MFHSTGGALETMLGVPVNKNLYSGSYVLINIALAISLVTLCYALGDIFHLQAFNSLMAPFAWLGKNSIAVYFGDEVCMPPQSVPLPVSTS